MDVMETTGAVTPNGETFVERGDGRGGAERCQRPGACDSVRGCF